MRNFSLSAAAIAALALLTLARPLRGEEAKPAPALRRPVAISLSADETLLYAVNRASGSVSVVSLTERRVVREIPLGKTLADAAPAPGGRLLAVDESRHELLVFDANGEKVAIQSRAPVAPYPVGVAVTRDGRRCFVTSLWSRRLTVLDLPENAAEPLRQAATLDLPFAPRKLLLVREDSRLIVADSFGGKLAVVDPVDCRLLAVREFPGHNIRGLGESADGRMLLVSHQMLNELAHTVRNDVHWGLLMSNDLRWLRLDAVLEEEMSLYQDSHMHPLGEAGRATADPQGVAVTDSGAVVVALGGVGEIAVGREDDFSLRRLKVGRRPTAVVVDRAGETAYVANTFGDSISVVDLKERETVAEISLGPNPELSPAERGELLFYDARLSHDKWMSCHSCHTDGHTNGSQSDNFSDKSFGAPKQVLSLLGRSGTEPFAWNGGARDFPEQIRRSLTQTMQFDEEPAEDEVAALAAYLQSLPPPPPIDLARGQRNEAAVSRGEKLFASLQCSDCHAPPSYTTPDVYDVGLQDKLGNHEFNPPSLVGAGQRGPFFHDGRAKSLEDVVERYAHQLPRELSETEQRDLLAFLRSL